jgi:hypothetical protein
LFVRLALFTLAFVEGPARLAADERTERPLWQKTHFKTLLPLFALRWWTLPPETLKIGAMLAAAAKRSADPKRSKSSSPRPEETQPSGMLPSLG